MSIEVYETMSTATMWLLLFVVAALALLIAALTKTKFTVQKISIIGIMAAMSFVAYEFFRIPNVFGTGCVRRSGRCHRPGAGRRCRR